MINQLELIHTKDTSEIKELMDYIHNYLDKKLMIENNIVHFNYDEPIESFLSDMFGISESLAGIITQDWIFSRLGSYYGVKFNDGDENWLLNRRFHHNEDKPAVIRGNTHLYYKTGLLHRENDLPAKIFDVTNPNGRKEWYYKDFLHRNNGKPAIVDGDTEEYYIYGQQVSKNITKLF